MYIYIYGTTNNESFDSFVSFLKYCIMFFYILDLTSFPLLLFLYPYLFPLFSHCFIIIIIYETS